MMWDLSSKLYGVQKTYIYVAKKKKLKEPFDYFQYLRTFITSKISSRLEMVEVSFRKMEILNVHFMD